MVNGASAMLLSFFKIVANTTNMYYRSFEQDGPIQVLSFLSIAERTKYRNKHDLRQTIISCAYNRTTRENLVETILSESHKVKIEKIKDGFASAIAGTIMSGLAVTLCSYGISSTEHGSIITFAMGTGFLIGYSLSIKDMFLQTMQERKICTFKDGEKLNESLDSVIDAVVSHKV